MWGRKCTFSDAFGPHIGQGAGEGKFCSHQFCHGQAQRAAADFTRFYARDVLCRRLPSLAEMRHFNAGVLPLDQAGGLHPV